MMLDLLGPRENRSAFKTLARTGSIGSWFAMDCRTAIDSRAAMDCLAAIDCRASITEKLCYSG